MATVTALPTPTPTLAATPTPSGPTLIPTACPASGCPTAAPTPTVTLSTTPAATLPPEILNQLLQIQAQVESERGLHAKSQVPLVLLTRDQLRQRVIDDLKTNYTPTDAQKDEFVLGAFGLIPTGLDMLALETNLQTEQIAGFYDDKTQQMYVVQGEKFGGNERLTYSHEFTHVLQDQNYNLRNGLKYNDDYCKDHSEYCGAVQALVEGDATESEIFWLRQFSTAQDKLDIAGAIAVKSPVYDSAPDYIKDSLIFPYQDGNQFVDYLYKQGGWAAVDAAYRNPPTCMAQIMHPELYPDFLPVTVALPDLQPFLGADWSKVDQNTLGEFDIYELLGRGANHSVRLPDNTAHQAAAGWAGDSYVLFKNSQNLPALVLKGQWSTETDSSEFASAFQTYAGKRWGKAISSGNNITAYQQGQAYVLFYSSGVNTIWVLAPDQATAQKLLDAAR